MPCGQKPLVKRWDKPRDIRKVKQSRYEQNERTVKQHWHNVLRDLENSYKDEKFWDTQSELVRSLVGTCIFKRLQKIFNLPPDTLNYKPIDEDTLEIIPSEEYYIKRKQDVIVPVTPAASTLPKTPSLVSEEKTEIQQKPSEVVEEEDNLSDWESNASTMDVAEMRRSKSVVISKSFVTVSQKKSSHHTNHTTSKSKLNRSSMFSSARDSDDSEDSSAKTNDDLIVHAGTRAYNKHTRNPHHKMLYCNESETDMIQWDSKYKKKTFEVSASDEFSKKAEIMTKQICKDYFDWWQSLGNVEFKSEIKRPQDVEDLFQVWFDEHASSGLVLETKILPCVIPAVAKATNLMKLSCPSVLKRLIAYDILAETSPAHTMAFGKCLPQHMKHVPPNNNTLQMWKPFTIPEDLRTMACVFEDVQHLTSTKAFQQWLVQRPHLPMAPFLRALDDTNRRTVMATSDFYLQDKAGGFQSAQDLAMPISQFSMELKEVLSKLMN